MKQIDDPLPFSVRLGHFFWRVRQLFARSPPNSGSYGVLVKTADGEDLHLLYTKRGFEERLNRLAGDRATEKPAQSAALHHGHASDDVDSDSQSAFKR